MTTDMVTLKHTMEPREAFDVLTSTPGTGSPPPWTTTATSSAS